MLRFGRMSANARALASGKGDRFSTVEVKGSKPRPKTGLMPVNSVICRPAPIPIGAGKTS